MSASYWKALMQNRDGTASEVRTRFDSNILSSDVPPKVSILSRGSRVNRKYTLRRVRYDYLVYLEEAS